MGDGDRDFVMEDFVVAGGCRSGATDMEKVLGGRCGSMAHSPGSLKRQHRARAAHDNERKTKARKDLGVVDGTV